MLAGYRTYVHARAFRANAASGWRGPVESIVVAGGLALLFMLSATAGAWAREPFHRVLAYIAADVVLTSVVGLVIGLILAAVAIVAIRLHEILM